MARVTYEGKRYPLLEGEDVLQALLRGGADVSFSCRKGTCQSCMLRAVEGDPGVGANKGLRPALAERGYFLPCRARPREDLLVASPDPSELQVRMHVHETAHLAPDVVRILLEPETVFTWRPGQFVNVRHPSGAVRSYSVASLPLEDYYVELHVKRVAGGLVSGWLADVARPGEVIEVQGPNGECVWDASRSERPLLLLGSGTGLAPLVGIAREALLGGHTGEVYLHHGAASAAGLYLDAALRALAAEYPRFHYEPCIAGSVVEAAAQRHADLGGFAVYLAGAPEMVHEARRSAYLAGADRGDIHADPFEHDKRFFPEDGAKLAALAPDPELWEALGQGSLLRAILADFYTRVYADPRLAPFFHKVTIERAIDKQYAFLRDVFSGSREYFGLKPFNAHHWMVVSDELFDYRERLIEGVMREHGLAEPLIRRWCGLHELFRREIVKAIPRGLIVDGVERELEPAREERLEVASVCDGCEAEMPEGSVGRLMRTGELFCARCAARRVGATIEPPLGP